MQIGFTLMLIAILTAIISNFTTRSLMRNYALEEIIQSQSVFRRVMSSLVFLAVFAAFVWGVINLLWWQVLLAILGASFVFLILIRQISLENWMSVEPVIQAIGVAASVYLWLGDV